jgi:selenocysteine-specific elongation factor
MEELRLQLSPHSTPRLFRAFVAALESEHLVVRDGSAIRLPRHTVAFTDEERRMADRLTELLGETPLSPPTLPELVRTTGIERGRLIPVLRVLERARSVVRISDDLYLLRESLERVTRTLRDEFPEGAEITPAMFRDRFATTRKYAIPLLEYLDVEGVTVRVGGVRRLRAVRTTSRPAV